MRIVFQFNVTSFTCSMSITWQKKKQNESNEDRVPDKPKKIRSNESPFAEKAEQTAPCENFMADETSKQRGLVTEETARKAKQNG